MILEADSLTKQFGSFTAVDDVSLDVFRGEIQSVIGPNGAGKTTLFGMLSGGLTPTKGTIQFNGNEITHDPEDVRVRKGISKAFQIAQLFPELSVFENLRLASQSNYQSLKLVDSIHEKTTAKATEMLDIIELSELRNQRASVLSHGDKKKLELGMAALTDPKLLLLDEPTSGVSESESQWIIEFIDSLSENVTILFIEHDIDMVLTISDRITVLEQGAVIARGDPAEIESNERVQDAYMGGY